MTSDSLAPVAFITGASRGIGATSAIALARAGFDLAITARTLADGEQHEHGSFDSNTRPLAGSLRATAAEVEALGQRCLCLRSDILEPHTVTAAVNDTLAHYGRIDLLFNNACYQGPGNLQSLLDVTPEQVQTIYLGNVVAPLVAVQAALPGMIARDSGTIINMVSASAVNDPPAPPDGGGWGFAYPASKAALLRMVPSLRTEYPGAGLRYFNVEPGFVYTEVMRANNFGEEAAARFKPSTPEEIAEVICWLACEREAAGEYAGKNLIYAPQLRKQLRKQLKQENN